MRTSIVLLGIILRLGDQFVSQDSADTKGTGQLQEREREKKFWVKEFYEGFRLWSSKVTTFNCMLFGGSGVQIWERRGCTVKRTNLGQSCCAYFDVATYSILLFIQLTNVLL